jgi:branched-chain amino acid transport system substrate-binding protein
MLADGGVDQTLLKFAEGTAEGVYATMPPIAEHLLLPAEWSEEFTRRSGHAPGPFTVQAYDAVTLAVDALRRSHSQDGTAVTRALEATSGLELLTGPGRFAADHTLMGFTFQLLVVRSGRFELAKDPTR